MITKRIITIDSNTSLSITSSDLDKTICLTIGMNGVEQSISLDERAYNELKKALGLKVQEESNFLTRGKK